jgi:hypothetical protein
MHARIHRHTLARMHTHTHTNTWTHTYIHIHIHTRKTHAQTHTHTLIQTRQDTHIYSCKLLFTHWTGLKTLWGLCNKGKTYVFLGRGSAGLNKISLQFGVRDEDSEVQYAHYTILCFSTFESADVRTQNGPNLPENIPKAIQVFHIQMM